MKKIILLVGFLIPFIAAAQDQEGVIRYLMVQNGAKKLAALDYISQQQKERMAYVWGSRSEWKAFTTLYFSPNITKYEDSEEKAEDDDSDYSWKKDAFLIHRNFATNTMHDVISLNSKAYIIDDTISYPEWKILNDMKEIAGHVCMNATFTDSLRMEKTIAWFALDIPSNGGPEHFGGLPGLILEIDINNGGVVITADKIELKKLSTELALPTKKIKGKKVNTEGFRTILSKHYSDSRKNERPPFWGMRY